MKSVKRIERRNDWSLEGGFPPPFVFVRSMLRPYIRRTLFAHAMERGVVFPIDLSKIRRYA